MDLDQLGKWKIWTQDELDKLLKGKRKQRALKRHPKGSKNHFFDRRERDIPQGRGEHLVVAYGIEKVNKLFFASNPPAEIPLSSPKKRRIDFTVCPLRLEVAGENLSSTFSEGTVIIANSWNNLTIPKRVTTIMTPSKIRNLLLRIGIGREVKVLGGKNHQED